MQDDSARKGLPLTCHSTGYIRPQAENDLKCLLSRAAELRNECLLASYVFSK